MIESNRTPKSRLSGLALVIGIEIVVFALFMALFLIEAGWIIILDVVLAIAVVVAFRFFPKAKEQFTSAFSDHPKATKICAAVLLLLVPMVLKSSPYWLFMLITVGVYIMAVLGLNLQLGSTGMMNMAGGAFMAFGAYSAGLLALDLGWPPVLTLITGALI
ncbi:hypothetical protein EG834_12945, partial [bacterium]|nr:hypothetical protein [bacterium]